MTQLPEDRTNRAVRIGAIVAAVCAVALAIWAPIYLINRDDSADDVIRVVGSQETQTSAPASTPAVGTAARIEFSDGVAEVTILRTSWVTTGKDNGVTPVSGNFLMLDVTIEAVSGTVSYDSQYFTAVDADEVDHLSDPYTAGYAPVLKAGDLAEGNTIRGKVGFDVARGVVELELAEPGGPVLATWVIPG